MQIITSLNDIKNIGRTAVALGNFDGIHLGHRAVLEDAVRAAGEKGVKALCYTFSNHPMNYILDREETDPAAVKLICTEEQKERMLAELGFDILVNVPFDETIMTMRAHDFINDILAESLGATSVSVGFNYTFGVRAEGKTPMLVEECGRLGIDVTVHDAVEMDGVVISSTEIRRLIKDGDVETASRYLGWELSYSGVVEHGMNIGRSEGFPTMNIPMPMNMVMPHRGVYFSRVQIDGKEYNSVSNVGIKPTVGGSAPNIETFIFDFDRDVYTKSVTVYLMKFRRGEVKFASREGLFRQIASDSEAARKWHAERQQL